MFVRDPSFFEHGDVVECTREITIPQGKFTIGHKFVITSTRDHVGTAMRCPITGYVITDPAGLSNIKFVESKGSTNDYDRPVSSQFQDR